MAISKDHPDFTRFVNAVLARERTSGTWTAIWQHWLGPVLDTRPPAPPRLSTGAEETAMQFTEEDLDRTLETAKAAVGRLADHLA